MTLIETLDMIVEEGRDQRVPRDKIKWMRCWDGEIKMMKESEEIKIARLTS